MDAATLPAMRNSLPGRVGLLGRNRPRESARFRKSVPTLLFIDRAPASSACSPWSVDRPAVSGYIMNRSKDAQESAQSNFHGRIQPPRSQEAREIGSFEREPSREMVVLKGLFKGLQRCLQGTVR